MKTKTRKTTRILCASTIAAMTILGSVAPALTTVAADGEVQLPVKANSITFDKKIYLDAGENVPNVTIGYRLSPRAATKEEKADFAKNGYDNVVTGNKQLSASSTAFSEGAEGLTKGEGYVAENSTINASSLLENLDKPTVFTYTLKEEVPEAAKGYISTDNGTTRDLNIYVGYADKDAENSKKLSVLYSTLSRKDSDGNTVKAVGFENDYNTNSDKKKKFTVTKKVTGNQGDKTKGFTFTVHISNQYSKVTASGTTTSLVESKLTPDSNHEVNFTVDLANDETLELTGVTKGATYTVTEDKAGYTQTATVDGTEVTADENTNTLKAAGDVKNDDDNKVVFTNNKEGTIPTGIYLNHKLPFNILGVALAGGAVALIAKKRHDDALEDEDDE